MGTPVKRSAQQAKHRTQAEILAREAAEASVMPEREGGVRLTKPRNVTGAAATYWNSLVQRLQGAEILDDLDREMLAGYCQMLVRRDQLSRLMTKLLAAAVKADLSEKTAEQTDALNDLASKLDKLDRTLLTYASKLGFTPEGRVRLAQKRAQAETDDADELGMFGG